MKRLKEYLEEDFNPEWDYVIEMVSIGRPILNKIHYHITVEGDRERPHIHIYLNGDKRPFSKFNFEIALDEILCYDEINLIRMRDKSKNINVKRRNKCSWGCYSKLKTDFEDWLFSDNVEIRGGFKDNLDAIIYFYNHESGDTENSNPLLEYIKRKGMKIKNKFRNYFSDYDINKYAVCFDK